ncbi:MAG: ceramidase [Bacteroidales bacterium]|nr:ceramidase [Bacteroidales bacterium]
MMDSGIFSKDHGPIYRETWLYLQRGENSFIVEPWNAYSSLLFIVGAFLIYIYLRKKRISFPFMQFVFIPLLFLGGLGSTFYHAFRAHRWIMWLDVMPMFVLTLAISFHFWQKITHRSWLTILILIFFILSRMTVFELLPLQLAINVSYAIVGIAMGLPLCWVAYKTHFYKLSFLIGAMIMFVISLFFRWLDDISLNSMPIGTHWLWHVFSTIGSVLAGIYIIHLFMYEKHGFRNI